MSVAVVRVCVLGAESTGKTTLERTLARRYETAWNPEYGRGYTEAVRNPGAPWTSAEFTHIARVQCWYEDRLAEVARGVLFCDTDAYSTAVFHQVYLGVPSTGFSELEERSYALYLVCGLDVPWRGDGIREFERQREWMHERYLERARSSGAPWLLLEGPHETRVATALQAVDRLLARR
jgi:NadR type nicotinamide-nucleotide adenylyltransferase